ncbi:MAG: intracellular septation protein [Bdellovibrionales bacterium RIFCSPHIGHO2_01_FULL_40_29]|nr:MAG: intracellular septation protein [Bdellovibrionales bacterium RIFCSPHIGHO2_01_FULL_40_29]OFZ33798.1 MAG: intracellular septation protein [Bdellovibrionales bacterium RIFCSPHIGHO2_02_FULL_40_15]
MIPSFNHTVENQLNLPSNPTPKSAALALVFGGILPIIAFTIIEEKYGTMAGLIAGMVLGVAEIIYETVRYRKVSTMTWIGNGMLLSLGIISLISSEGIWFKLQPALLEFGFFIFLSGSWLMKKPFMKLMIEKQNPTAPDFLKDRMSGMTLRLGIFFLLHAMIATWAAFFWSTEHWALLKGVGITISMIVYMAAEIIWMRRQLRKLNNLHK